MNQAARNLLMHLEVRRIVSTDLAAVSRFFAKVVESGIDRVFHPHPFDSQTAQGICGCGGMDWYAGCFICSSGVEHMVGYVMLRGWDAGFAIPSLGVCILPSYQRMGLGRMLLNVAIYVARLRGSPSIRLKVYPDNRIAVALYRSAGFRFDEDLEEGQMVGHLKLRAIGNTFESG